MSLRDIVTPTCDDTSPLSNLVNTQLNYKQNDLEGWQPHEDLSLEEVQDGFERQMPPSWKTLDDQFFQDDFYDQFEASSDSLLLEEPQLYVFGAENPFRETQESFQIGMELYKQGNLHDAILAFEACIQRYALHDPNTSDAWRWLGTAHAENDQDKQAIICHQNAVLSDPQNLEALLEIGVSHANELNPRQSLNYLKSWLQQHPEYQTIPELQFDDQDYSRVQLQDKVIEMFQRAARMTRDPDLHTVLGVLFNLNYNYAEAEKEFMIALEMDPTSHSLWNKLGATRANSPKQNGSKEAIPAYRKAIELKPNYVRSWVNMGISYSNQGKYDLSSKYYLKALSLNPKAEHIWGYLRSSLINANMSDLANQVDSHNVDLFHSHFKF